MLFVETDLEKIKRIADRNENKNIRFRTFLKGKDSKKLDSIVHRLNKEISSRIDCDQCGNCCMKMVPGVGDKEIDVFSKIENVSRDVFIEKYTEIDEYGDNRILKGIPCRYLKDKKCSVSDDRPDACKSFPHLHKPHFNSRTLNMLQLYAICPIVFNVFERLKDEYRFR